MFIQFANITTGTWLGIVLIGAPFAALSLWGLVQWLNPAARSVELSRRINHGFDGLRFSLFILLPTALVWIGLLSVLPWWSMVVLYSFSITLVGTTSMIVELLIQRTNSSNV